MTVPIVPGQPPITTGHGMTPMPLRPPPPPRKKGLSTGATIAIIFGAVFVVGIIFVIFVATVIRAGSGASVPDGEITITSCGETAAGNVRAEVRVENKSKTDKTYFITVEFVEGNQRLGTGLIVVNDLHPGQSTNEDAIALHQSTGHFTCRVSDVNRY